MDVHHRFYNAQNSTAYTPNQTQTGTTSMEVGSIIESRMKDEKTNISNHD